MQLSSLYPWHFSGDIFYQTLHFLSIFCSHAGRSWEWGYMKMHFCETLFYDAINISTTLFTHTEFESGLKYSWKTISSWHYFLESDCCVFVGGLPKGTDPCCKIVSCERLLLTHAFFFNVLLKFVQAKICMHANLEGKRWRMETSEISYILVPLSKLIEMWQ